ncbi:MAG: hypothetical protein AB7G37_16955 [Solirubrobacteraceae bacterium]
MTAAKRPERDAAGKHDRAKAGGGRGGTAGVTPPTSAGTRPTATTVRRLTDADARGGRLMRRRPSGGEGGDDGGGAVEVIRPSRPFLENLAVLAGAMVGGTLVAEFAGAANLGTALSFGQIAFAIALVFVLLRR